MEDLYNQLINKCIDNDYSGEELELIKKAYKYACKQHEGMKRKNGEDYITHPLNVALIVANLNTDATTVISALLHETVYHGSSSYEEISEIFGSDVGNIVTSLDKVNKLHLIDDSESSSLYLRKVLVALSEDVRVIILKLAGRVHNLRTNDALDDKLQKQKAKETWNVLIPIAHRLGIYGLKSELEDLSFKYLKPEIYEEIETSLPAPREELENILNNTMDDLKELLRQNDIAFEMKGRVKSVSSIHNKLSNGKKWNEIYDILGIRVICDEISECYQIIGLIHSVWRPIPKRFKDYIAMPKGNSYQSLHTGVFGENEFPIEIQVRTKEMNEIAEHGVASHVSYKEKNSKHIQNVMEQKLQMFRNIIEANSDDVKDDDEYITKMEEEILSKSIYVLTPRGDVVELPKDASPIDFAYRIHTNVGNQMIGAIVNGNIVGLDYKLQDNDIIKIMTKEGSTPNKDWLNIVKTSQAKNKIKAYFSKQDSEEFVKRGREMLERELRRQKLSITDALSDEHKEKLIKDLKVGSFDEVLLNIGSLRYTPIYVTNLIYEDKQDIQDVLLDKVMNNANVAKIKHKNSIVVNGMDDILFNLASCCTPVYGDEIIGYITKGQGITVHKCDCVNVRDLTTRLINVEWNSLKLDDTSLYIAKLLIETNGINPSLIDIVTKSSVRGVSISSINEVRKNGNLYYDVIVKVSSKNMLDMFIDDLVLLPFVKSVRRV